MSNRRYWLKEIAVGVAVLSAIGVILVSFDASPGITLAFLASAAVWANIAHRESQEKRASASEARDATLVREFGLPADS